MISGRRGKRNECGPKIPPSKKGTPLHPQSPHHRLQCPEKLTTNGTEPRMQSKLQTLTGKRGTPQNPGTGRGTILFSVPPRKNKEGVLLNCSWKKTIKRPDSAESEKDKMHPKSGSVQIAPTQHPSHASLKSHAPQLSPTLFGRKWRGPAIGGEGLRRREMQPNPNPARTRTGLPRTRPPPGKLRPGQTAPPRQLRHQQVVIGRGGFWEM